MVLSSLRPTKDVHVVFLVKNLEEKTDVYM